MKLLILGAALLFVPWCSADIVYIPYGISFTYTPLPNQPLEWWLYDGYGPMALPTFGGFTYDPANHLFADFSVVWYGVRFDLTSVANSPHMHGDYNIPCLGGAAGAEATFRLLRGDCADGGFPGTRPMWQAWPTWPGQSAYSFTFSVGDPRNPSPGYHSVTAIGWPTVSIPPGATTGGDFVIGPPYADVVGVPEPDCYGYYGVLGVGLAVSVWGARRRNRFGHPS
jgi:hypothetical protein